MPVSDTIQLVTVPSQGQHLEVSSSILTLKSFGKASIDKHLYRIFRQVKSPGNSRAFHLQLGQLHILGLQLASQLLNDGFRGAMILRKPGFPGSMTLQSHFVVMEWKNDVQTGEALAGPDNLARDKMQILPGVAQQRIQHLERGASLT